MLVILKVEDYAKWKSAFDGHAATRKAYGSKGGHVFRSADNPNEVVVLMEWDSLEKVRQFAQSDDLRKAMQQSGVSDQPNIYFLEEVDRPSV
jgi:heme-degrading monooxygenase HmoA